MFIVLLLLARAAGDWVEISQQHYRKPLRHYNFDDTALHLEESTTNTNKIYDNHSLTDYVWKGSVDKVPKHGSVQRVQLDSNAVKAPSLRDTNTSIAFNQDIHNLRDVIEEDEIHFKNSFPTSDEKFQQTNRPSNNFGVFGKTRYRNATQNAVINPGHENSYHVDDGFRTTLTNKHTHREDSESSIPRRHHPEDMKNRFVIEKVDKDLFSMDPFDKYDSSTDAYSSSSVIEVFTRPHRIEDQSNIDRHSSSAIAFDRSKINDFSKKGGVKSNVQFVSHSEYSNEDQDVPITQIPKNPFTTNEKQIDDKDKIGSPAKEGNTVEILMKFMKVVGDTIRRNTRRSVRSKTRYLQDLRDTILANIEDRIEHLWPDDEPPARGRRRRAAWGPSETARGTLETARGHLEVPSSESALMTISFLTFAVFLIKLVLQVIQTYKNKTMMVAPTVVAAVGRLAALRKQ